MVFVGVIPSLSTEHQAGSTGNFWLARRLHVTSGRLDFVHLALGGHFGIGDCGCLVFLGLVLVLWAVKRNQKGVLVSRRTRASWESLT